MRVHDRKGLGCRVYISYLSQCKIFFFLTFMPKNRYIYIQQFFYAPKQSSLYNYGFVLIFVVVKYNKKLRVSRVLIYIVTKRRFYSQKYDFARFFFFGRLQKFTIFKFACTYLCFLSGAVVYLNRG